MTQQTADFAAIAKTLGAAHEAAQVAVGTIYTQTLEQLGSALTAGTLSTVGYNVGCALAETAYGQMMQQVNDSYGAAHDRIRPLIDEMLQAEAE